MITHFAIINHQFSKVIYPQSFIDDLRAQADIVAVVQEYVSLKKAGATYKGLCPFHSEKTPSFHVNREKGFFHCFGCNAGGDVFKFLQMQEQLSFPDAVRQLAAKFGVPLPEPVDGGRERETAAEREALLKLHEVAVAYFQEQLAAGAGARARQQLRERGLTPETIAQLALGFAPAGRDGLKERIATQGVRLSLALASGLLVEREDGQVTDRFRGRLMVPICRDSGSVVAFGGRAMEAEQTPKYLNSPETPIYTKSRTLYGLSLTKAAIRRQGYAVLVEGYFDFAQLLQAGVANVVASCGTALTTQQAQLLRRFTSKVVLSFDPDAAGQGAAARSCELLVSEGFDVNVAVLPAGEDPDAFVRRRGREAYVELLRTSRPYLDYLLDRSAEAHDLATDEGRRQFLNDMLVVAARIPDPAGRDRFADRLAHKARVTEEVVRAEIRKAAVARRTQLTSRELPGFGELKRFEIGLIWALVHDPAGATAALAGLDEEDLEGLISRNVLQVARALQDRPVPLIPAALLERLSTVEAQLVTGIASSEASPWSAVECAREIRRLRYERERAAVRREIDRLQGLDARVHDGEITALMRRMEGLLHRIQALTA